MVKFLIPLKLWICSFFKKSEVVFIFRKPFLSGNYSVEYLFGEIFRQLEHKIECKSVTPMWHSQGIIRRILICFETYFKRGKVNIITGDISFVAAFLPKKSSILVVLDCGLLYDTHGFKRWIRELIWYRMPFHRSSYVVTISEATKKDLLAITNGDPSKIRVIPCFIDSGFKRVDKTFDKKRPVLLQIGQATNKNLTRIIQSIKNLSVHLSIIGTIDKDNAALLKQFKIDFSVAVNLTDEEVLQKYVDCDMLVFPSTYEGFGLPIIEAQTVGRAVITSNTTSMPWVAGVGACFVDPYSIESIRSGIVRLINDDQYRIDLVEGGYENARRFQPTKIAAMYHDLVLVCAGNK